MHLQLAWRNIWRNPRRTTVILIAVIIGVWNMIFCGALMRGVEIGMIKNGIATLTGNIQIHRKGYRNDPSIENSITDAASVEAVLEKVLPSEAQWTSRVRVSAIAANARHSGGVTLVGIDPAPESKVSFIGHAVTKGQYLAPDDIYGIVVGRALLDKFETKIGRKLVLMSQTSQGDIASRAFRIVGVFAAEMQSTEKQFVFVTLPAARKMLKLKNSVSEFSIVLPESVNNGQLAADLRSALPSDLYEVDTWQDLLPMLKAYLKLSDAFIYIWYLVIFIAMGFGIVNTTLMAVFERMREFGLLKALGMKPSWIMRAVLTEVTLILLVGIFIGNILAFLNVLALSGSGIDLSALAAGVEYAGMSRILIPVIFFRDAFIANLVVFILGLVVCLYPATKAARFIPVEALAHN